MSRQIPVILCIDIEPDAQVVARDLRAPWRGYELVHDFLTRLRPQLAAATGSPAHFSWFLRMDPQVEEVYGAADWAVSHYAEHLEDARAEGDELGLHPHTFRWDEGGPGWIIDCEDQAWVDHCIRTSFAAYEQSVGQRCASIRFGDRWLNQAAVDLAEALGARFDLTIEPGAAGQRNWKRQLPCRGEIPDYSGAPRSPYQPSRADFRRPGDPGGRALWMVPLSSARLESGWAAWWRSLPLARADRTVTPRYRTMNPEGIWSRTFCRHVEQVTGGREKPYLAMAARSSIGLEPHEMKNFGEVLDYLSSRRGSKHFVFTTPREALAMLGYVDVTGE